MPLEDAPDWITETPEEPQYMLAMIDYDRGGSALQEVEITRAEYIALKQHLAQMRGLVPAAPGE